MMLPNAYGTLSRSSLTVRLWIIRSRFSAASFPWRRLVGWVVRSLMDICGLFPIIIIRLGVLFDSGSRGHPGCWTLALGRRAGRFWDRVSSNRAVRGRTGDFGT